MRRRTRTWVVRFGSDRLRGSQERRRARHDLRNGREPAPRYTTKKFWTN